MVPRNVPIEEEYFDWEDTPVVRVRFSQAPTKLFRIESDGSRVEIDSSALDDIWLKSTVISEEEALSLAKARADDESSS